MDVDKRINEICSDIANEMSESDQELVERLEGDAKRHPKFDPPRGVNLDAETYRTLLSLARKGLAAEGLVEAVEQAKLKAFARIEPDTLETVEHFIQLPRWVFEDMGEALAAYQKATKE